VIRNAKGVKAGEVVHFYPNGVKPWSEIRISWEGPAWRIGYIRYKTQQGLLRTCPLFTALEDDAVKFYKQHGFTEAAKNAVLNLIEHIYEHTVFLPSSGRQNIWTTTT
jgi:hypothetical protein